ncbi:hypothetical protein CAL21_19595 [Bordetella genomosp. 4]|nr:hypothetical protein CAL21_19595 [Bordetella genomosp. 4]
MDEKMKKVVGITTGVVVIAVAGWLGATWYTGKRIQTEEPVRLTELNKELATALGGTGFGVTISQISYDRHFFSSDVRYGIQLTKVPGEEAPPKGMVEIVGRIEHGPFPKGALARGQWLPKLAFVHSEVASNDLVKPLFELTKGVSPLVGDTILSYNGDGVGTATIAPIEYAPQTDQSVKFSGAQFEGSFVRATKHAVGTGKINQLALQLTEDDEGQKVNANITGMTVDVDSQQGKFGFGVGSSGAKFDNIVIEVEEPLDPYADETSDEEEAAQAAEEAAKAADEAANAAQNPSAESQAPAQPEQPAEPEQAAPAPAATVKTKIELKDLAYTAKIAEQDTTINVAADYKIGQIAVNGSDFGKGHATIKFDKIDGKAAKALSDLYNEMLTKVANGTEDSSADGAQAIELVNQAIQLLAANPTMRVDPFVWETAKGQSNLNLAIELTKPAGLVAGKELPDDAKQLLQQSVKLIDMKVSVSKPMVEGLAAQYLQGEGIDAAAAAKEAADQVTSMAGMAEMFGIAKTDGDNVVSTFHYADGKANLNGEEVPADELFGALLSSVDDDHGYGEDSENTLLNSLDPAQVAQMVSDIGFDYELGTTEYDTPVLKIDGTNEGAKSVEILFNDCESESACTDMQMRITVATPYPVPMRVLNEWNQTNRLTRAYWDAENKVATMEMDVNAYGGVGQDNVEFTVQMFLANVSMFTNTIKEAPRK